MDDSSVTELSQSARTDLFAENENSEEEMESLMVLEDQMSDDDNEPEFNAVKQSKKKPSRILDDSDDDDMNERLEDPPDVSNSAAKKQPTKKKISALIDSDSEPEVPNKGCGNDPDSSKGGNKKSVENADSSEEDVAVLKKSKAALGSASPNGVKKRVSAIIDSDSESDNETDKLPKQKNRKVRKNKKFPSKSSKHEKKSKDKGSNILSGLNLDLGSSSESTKSSSNSDNSDSDLSGDEFVRQSANSNIQEEGRKQRLSAKEAMDQMKVIQSESQRMAREHDIDIPYHKPKQHSLKEFLSRKTVNKPIIRPICERRTTAARIKMTPEELEAYAKMLEERRKEAEEFFKNESEPEEVDEEQNLKKPQDPNDEKFNETKPDEEANSLCTKSTTEFLKEMDKAITEDNEINSDITDTNLEQTITLNDVNTANNQDEIETSEIVQPDYVINKDQEFIEISTPNDKDIDKIIDNVATENKSPNLKMSNEIEIVSELATNSNAAEQPVAVKKSKKLFSLIGDLPPLKPIQYDPNLLIDLETGDVVQKVLTGAELLKERYLKNACKPKTLSQEADLKVVTLENGLQVEHIKVKSGEKNIIAKDVKPGAAYFKLKRQLEKKITENRLKEVLKKDEYAKKLEEEQELYSDDDMEFEDSDNENERMDLEGGDTITEINEEVNEENPGETDKTEANLENDNNDSDDSSSSDSSSDEDDNALEKSEPRKSRIIKAFVDSEDEIDESSEQTNPKLNEMTNSCTAKDELSKTMSEENIQNETPTLETSDFFDDVFKLPDLRKTPEKNKAATSILGLNCEVSGETMNTMQLLWDGDTEKPSDYDDISDLCSGRFGTATQATEVHDSNASTSGIKDLCDGFTQQIDEEDLSELCSGRFTAQPNEPSAINDQNFEKDDKIGETTNKFLTSRRQAILSSDEEGNGTDSAEKTEKKAKKLRKKRRRRQVLEISDDENSLSDIEQQEEEEEELLNESEDEEQPDTFVDYDSEENEVEVQLTKKDTVAAAKNFFEKEAELSGSEYGSADEDEKDLDRFEAELGDEDQFDADQLQSELGKIHMRRLLDQDTREVKILQDMFFEDEEKDGVGRTRKFVWKNLDINIDLMTGVEGKDDDNLMRESDDDENEEQWRKMRHEREMLLAKNMTESESNLELSESQTGTLANITNKNVSSETLSTKRKVMIIKKQANAEELQKKSLTDSPFLISFDKVHKESRASFLIRDEDTLNKLAGMVKEKDTDSLNTALGKARNFVFSTVTPPTANQIKKRPSDAEVETENRNKRQRIEKLDQHKPKKRLLDSLA